MSNNPSLSDANAFAYDVFISYSHKDAAWVRGELLRTLEQAGLKVCIDFRDFRIGAPSVTEMERGVVSSRHTLLVLTPAYLNSQWAEFEALLTQTLSPSNRDLRLIPLRKAECELPLRIGYLTYVDFSDQSTVAFAWQQLLTALQAAPSANPAPSAPGAAAPAPPEAAAEALRALRDALADLYPDKVSALRVADDAGLTVAQLAVQDRAIDNWHEILKQAQRHNRLAQLVTVVRDEYGANPALQAALRRLGQ